MKIIKTLLLTRHGSTAYNEDERLQGLIDIPINDKGVEEAGRISQRLQNEPIDIIFHTPLIRTKETAEIINRHHQAPLTVIDSFIEIDIGDWEGRNFHEVVEENPEIYQQWISNPQVAVPGGESFQQLFQRIKPGVDQVLACQFECILIVAHAMVNRAIMGHLLGINPLSARRFRTDHCSFSRLLVYQTSNGRHTVADTWNSIDHLIHK
jgi:broad specificity phosphatase PhoE